MSISIKLTAEEVKAIVAAHINENLEGFDVQPNEVTLQDDGALVLTSKEVQS